MEKKDYLKNFHEEYSRLNENQKKAVDEIEGPVLVIAGPGTGKTQILAARIGNILLKTDSHPENILCLTYTEAGTIAMRKRLLSFIGPDAYKIPIHTFHSFCNLVIQENLDYFGLKALEPISDLEKIEVMKEIIDEIDINNPLFRVKGDPYFESYRLSSLFELMKKEDYSPQQMVKAIDEYIDDLPNRDEYIYKRATSTKDGKQYKKGDLKEDSIKSEIAKIEKLRAGVFCFEKYQEKLKKRNRYDFYDMILWVIDAFKKEPNILLKYQERFLYFLVDEFQDTSGAQSEIMEFLIDYWDVPNVFVVGDDDQSIFAFQNANIKNIINFSNKYQKNLKTIVLEKNYRSNQPILNTAEALIDYNFERLVKQLPNLTKKLEASLPARLKESHLPEVREYHNFIHETVDIAKEIEKLYQENYPLNEIAVIYRKHSQAEPIVKYLESKGIPLNIKKRLNLLDEILVQQILTILKYIDKEVKNSFSGEDLLIKILHYSFLNIPTYDIAHLVLNTHEKNSKVRIELAKYKNQTEEGYNPFKRINEDIEYWIKSTQNLTLQQLIEKIINRSGLLSYALSNEDKIWNMQVLHSFFEFVKDENAKNTKLNLSGFLNQIRLLEINQLNVPIEKIIYSPNGVNFVTAHSSKGLEFDYVYLISCNKEAWDKGVNRGFTLPDTLTQKVNVDEIEENRRLFYVALTRAKKKLIISYSNRNLKDKELEKTPFIAEIQESSEVNTKNIHLPADELLDFEMNILNEKPVPDIELLEKEFLDKILDDYSMSVTHLNNYLDCPLKFYYLNVIRVPSSKNPASTFGSAIHHCLQQFFTEFRDTNQLPNPDKLLKDFDWYMKRNEDAFLEEDFKRYSEYGKEILPKYYEFYKNTWTNIVSVEKKFKGIVMDGVLLNGAIDKIEFEGKNAHLIDYKTGKYQKNHFYRADLEANPEEKEKYFGGKYWRQAVFYKILVDYDNRKDWDMVSAHFDYVEPDQNGVFHKEKVIINSEDISIVKKQINEAYHSIKELNFKGCGKEDCEWCNMIKFR